MFQSIKKLVGKLKNSINKFILADIVIGASIGLFAVFLGISLPFVAFFALMGSVLGLFTGPWIRRNFFPTLHYQQQLHEYNRQPIVLGLRIIEAFQRGENPNIPSNCNKDYLLIAAIHLNQSKAVRKLVDLGAKITPRVIEAAVVNASLLKDMPREKSAKSVLQFLMNKTRDLNKRNVNISDSLLCAVELDARKVAKILLKNGVNAKIKDDQNQYILTSKLNDPTWRKMLIKHHDALNKLYAIKEKKISLRKKDLSPELLNYYKNIHSSNFTAIQFKTRDYYQKNLKGTKKEFAQWGLKKLKKG